MLRENNCFLFDLIKNNVIVKITKNNVIVKIIKRSDIYHRLFYAKNNYTYVCVYVCNKFSFYETKEYVGLFFITLFI